MPGMDIRVHTVLSDKGFFSMLDTLLSALRASERDGIPLYADWSGATNYLNEPGNLFDRFFEQPFGIRAEDLENHRVVETVRHASPYWNRDYRFEWWYRLDKKRIGESSRLLKKYVTVKAEYAGRADAFFRERLSPRTLGVHLRGGDMTNVFSMGHVRTPPVSSYVKAASRELGRGGYSHLFCSSDDQRLLDVFLRRMGETGALPLTVVTSSMQRSASGESLHLKPGAWTDKCRLAEDVLVEMLLLSRCAFLVKTPSNVSNFAVFFNPTLPFFDVTTLPVERMRRAANALALWSGFALRTPAKLVRRLRRG